MSRETLYLAEGSTRPSTPASAKRAARGFSKEFNWIGWGAMCSAGTLQCCIALHIPDECRIASRRIWPLNERDRRRRPIGISSG